MMAQPIDFGITPEKQASQLQYYRRRFFETCPVTTRSDVDLGGKAAILTGASGGIGVECARQLLDLGLSKLGKKETATSPGRLAQNSLRRSITRLRMEVLHKSLYRRRLYHLITR